ncbi:bifunctional diguanylate cyclase/phosphodiesterase [Pseudoalteromonas luteoviolacea]|uniref:bifunctional diguanylate cyclase/phosphodiesterase n=1 Tax=Pseudoalteromonas luteoviolacea TaxID=43657 RepID=UPI00114DA2A1|nr:EAL domain-containing protein [Pseudoalteromonas luteoviolacea]TQF72240.1 EAL domain-containing protein [Pseudoalteromonas luteoviolacea]
MLLLSLPGFTLILALLFAQRADILHIKEQDAIFYANQIATQQRVEIADTQQLLGHLAANKALLTTSKQPCPQLLQHAKLLNQEFANFGLATPNGRVFCSLHPLKDPISITDRAYFLQAIRTRDFSIGEYQQDRSIHSATLNFAQPVYQDEQLQMIIFAVRQLTNWSESLSHLPLPVGTRVMIADHFAQIVAEFPYSDKSLGRAVSEDWPANLSPRATILEDESNHHHVYLRLPLHQPQSELSIYFDFPFDDALHEVNRQFGLILLAFLIAVCFLIWLGRQQLRSTLLLPLHDFSEAIGALAHGKALKLDQKNMPKELADLAAHFETMAGIRIDTEQELNRKHAELNTLINALPDDFLRLDKQANILDQHGLRVTGRRTLNDIFPTHINIRIKAALVLLQEKPTTVFEYAVKEKNQSKVYEIRIHKIAQIDEAILIMRDISKKKQQEEALNLAALTYNNSSECMVITDAQGYILDTNPAFTKVTGYAQHEVIGKTTSILSSGKYDPSFYEQLWRSLLSTGKWQGEIINKRKNGELYTEWLTIDTVYDEHGEAYRRVGIFADITDKKRKDEQLWRQSHFDELTDLPNRTSLKKQLNTLFGLTNHNFAVLLLDIDHFKDINDTLGHYYGDLLLAQIAQRLKKATESVARLTRIGGDEFVLVYDHCTDQTQAIELAEKVLSVIKAPFTLADETCYVAASIGVALAPHDGKNTEQLLKAADQAMYKAKQLGRNGFALFSSDLREQAEQRILLLKDMRQALCANQFVMYFQPIVTMQTMEIAKAEALIRWQHPTKGIVSPAEFIPLAEETQLIHQLGEIAFTQAVDVLKQTQHFKNKLQLSINVSPVQFSAKHTTLLAWQGQLAKHQLTPDMLVLEITEGLMMQGEGRSQKRLTKLIQQGFAIALDDFGTGYSSLAYLKQMDTEFIKIDKRFVDGIEHNEEDLVLCETMILMAHQLGLKVIAEGIETATQHELLKQAGCDFGQGYFYSKPLPVEMFIDHLNTRNKQA